MLENVTRESVICVDGKIEMRDESNFNEKIVSGKVVRIASFAAFVNVNGFDCFAHISDLSWTNIKNPADVLELNATYDFVIYTGKLVNSIDIISNDGSTIYQTIDTSNLSVNKYYKITQEVEII